MAHDDEEVCDKDDRTIFVRGFNDKITEKLLFELFFQAGKFSTLNKVQKTNITHDFFF